MKAKDLAVSTFGRLKPIKYLGARKLKVSRSTLAYQLHSWSIEQIKTHYTTIVS